MQNRVLKEIFVGDDLVVCLFSSVSHCLVDSRDATQIPESGTRLQSCTVLYTRACYERFFFDIAGGFLITYRFHA